MSFTEVARIQQWLEATLTGDATLAALVVGGWFNEIAPPKTADPFGILQHHAGHDVLGNASKRIMSDNLYDVKLVGRARNFATLVTAADRVDALINRQSGNAGSDGRVLECRREMPFVYREVISGESWTHLGGTYRIWAQALSGLAQ